MKNRLQAGAGPQSSQTSALVEISAKFSRHLWGNYLNHPEEFNGPGFWP